VLLIPNSRGDPDADPRLPLLGKCPIIGSEESIGVPGKGVDLPDEPVRLTIASGSCPGGWLYIHVAQSTVVAPMMNDGVMRKWKSATDARKERIMESEVAKPLRMLSEYLMTTAVTSPPKTWIATVAHAQGPKLRKTSRRKPREMCDGAGDE
jgi:hypothetical protein